MKYKLNTILTELFQNIMAKELYPHDLAKGGHHNIKTADLARMLKDHGFVPLRSSTRAGYILYEHPEYPDIIHPRISRRAGVEDAASVAMVGKVCMQVRGKPGWQNKNANANLDLPEGFSTNVDQTLAWHENYPELQLDVTNFDKTSAADAEKLGAFVHRDLAGHSSSLEILEKSYNISIQRHSGQFIVTQKDLKFVRNTNYSEPLNIGGFLKSMQDGLDQIYFEQDSLLEDLKKNGFTIEDKTDDKSSVTIKYKDESIHTAETFGVLRFIPAKDFDQIKAKTAAIIAKNPKPVEPAAVSVKPAAAPIGATVLLKAAAPAPLLPTPPISGTDMTRLQRPTAVGGVPVVPAKTPSFKNQSEVDPINLFTFGDMVKAKRIAIKMGQQELADKVNSYVVAHTPAKDHQEVTREKVRGWEFARSIPNADEFEALQVKLIDENSAVIDKAAKREEFKAAYEKVKAIFTTEFRTPTIIEGVDFISILRDRREEMGLVDDNAKFADAVTEVLNRREKVAELSEMDIADIEGTSQLDEKPPEMVKNGIVQILQLGGNGVAERTNAAWREIPQKPKDYLREILDNAKNGRVSVAAAAR